MPKIDGLVTFLYFDDLERATQFYRDVMGLKITVDQGWAKILRLTDVARLGSSTVKRGV